MTTMIWDTALTRPEWEARPQEERWQPADCPACRGTGLRCLRCGGWGVLYLPEEA